MSTDSTRSESPGLDGLPTAFQSEDQLVIALDFGTTFSGVAYAFANGPKPDVISIMDWPGLEGFQQPKVPTLICYDANEPGGFTWGGQKHKTDVVQGVKLLLDPDQPRPVYLPESTARSDLRRLAKPAIEAAKLAGIHPVTLIKEPEAAAMYTLHKMQDKALAVGDAFVICDAGGGTVDLISYEITQLFPRLELKELVPGKGGMAGSLGLNKRFEEAVKNLVGEEQFFHLRKSRGFTLAVQQFDRSVKTAFRGDLYEDYYVNFPMARLNDDPDRNLIANCWNMKGCDVKAIFDPLIQDIERLVDEQVNLVTMKRVADGHPKADQIKAIFLVGGFGSSQYLKSCLEKDHLEIQVIQPHGAWGAIAKGAVLSQLPQEALIVSNQATRHYGVEATSLFEERTDKGQMKHFDKSTGKYRVARMTWYIHRGEDLLREQTIKFPFFRSLEDGFLDRRLIFRSELIQSECKTAPIYPSPSSTTINCVLTADLRSVDRSHFKKRIGVDGVTYVDVHFDLVITIKPAVMKFSLEINGKEMGTVNAKYD
ncbi:hypothetical protein G7Y89_g11485 [Cudoniella acicularis]|uniref:Uncharacterized protein n=1 Tax=Cudoniella acicularis TaxID=354080 RepID=A0A8H4RAU1_9HELO|nr:hypothetical protein G7Y89_g11485 [Cudoniella acicularis]